jgi:hypothetical protein
VACHLPSSHTCSISVAQLPACQVHNITRTIQNSNSSSLSILYVSVSCTINASYSSTDELHAGASTRASFAAAAHLVCCTLRCRVGVCRGYPSYIKHYATTQATMDHPDQPISRVQSGLKALNRTILTHNCNKEPTAPLIEMRSTAFAIPAAVNRI